MKKLLVILLSAMLILTLASCATSSPSTSPSATPSAATTPASTPPATTPPASPVTTSSSPPAATPVELHVFAAASLTNIMTDVANLYNQDHPNVKLTFTFDSSGTLQTQIEQGAACDVFLSAAQKQMDALAGENLIDAASRVNLWGNQLVLVVPRGNPAGITSFADAATKAKTIALGNSDVPAGQYAQQVFTNMGVWDQIQAIATLGSDVKEVTSWVSQGAADCGVVYATDATTAGLQIVASPPDGTLTTPVTYPGAVTGSSANGADAQVFLAFLQSAACKQLFTAAGFTTLS